jgi:hypothetical protein
MACKDLSPRRQTPAGERYEMQRVRQNELWMRQGRQVHLCEGLRLREEVAGPQVAW